MDVMVGLYAVGGSTLVSYNSNSFHFSMMSYMESLFSLYSYDAHLSYVSCNLYPSNIALCFIYQLIFSSLRFLSKRQPLSS